MAAIVFCWVDIVLVKLSEAIVTLSSRLVGNNTGLNGSLASLERQKEEAAIIAATQLPRMYSLSHSCCTCIHTRRRRVVFCAHSFSVTASVPCSTTPGPASLIRF